MIIKDLEKSESFIPDTLETEAFTMKISPEAFRATIDNLYKDRIGSPVREYMANAFDAHRSVGTTRSFEVHVPSFFEPYFEVKDYGPGMDRATISNFFISLFSSSKTNTNDQVGFFGLGCKAALTYTDSFEVVSRQGGKKSSYTIVRENKDIPRLLPLRVEDTTEDDGLSVRYNVKTADIVNFENAISSAMTAYFDLDIKPKLSFEVKAVSEAIASYNNCLHGQSKKIVYLVKDESRGHGCAYVRMGAILYPTQARALTFSFSSEDYTTIIDVPVGTYKPTTSREELVLSQDEVRLLNAAVDQSKNIIIDQLLAEPKAKKTALEAWFALRDMGIRYPNSVNLTWQNKRLSDALVVDEVKESFKNINFYAPSFNKSNTAFDLKEPRTTSYLIARFLDRAKLFYYPVESLDKLPRGALRWATEAGFMAPSRWNSNSSDVLIFILADQVPKLKAAIGSSINLLEVEKKKAEPRAKSDPVDAIYWDRNGSEIAEIDDYLEECEEEDKTVYWTTHSESSGLYWGARKNLSWTFLQFATKRLDIEDQAVVLCSKVDAKKIKLTEDTFIPSLLGEVTQEEIEELIVDFAEGERHFADQILTLIKSAPTGVAEKEKEYLSTIHNEKNVSLTSRTKILSMYLNLKKEHFNV